MKKKWILLLALAGMLAVTAACGSKKVEEDNNTDNTDNTEAVQEAAVGEFTDSKVVKLGNYKGVEVEAVSTEVTEEDIQEEINTLLKAYPDTQPVEGKTVVEDGDTVNIDYVGILDGEPFEGGTSPEGGYNLTIGSGSFIPGFEDGLIGKETGTSFDLPLTFPDPYRNNPDMSGKDVVFEVTVNEIVEFVDPDFTDEFVQTYTGYSSVDEYMEETKKSLEALKVQNAQEEKEYNVVQAIIADTEFDCADSDLETLKNATIQEYQTYASYYGMEFADFLSYFMNGMTEEAFEQQAAELADFQLKSQLVIKAISEAEAMSLTEEEYQEGLAGLVEEFQAESAEAFEEQYGREMIEDSLIYDKTVDFVVEQAVEI